MYVIKFPFKYDLNGEIVDGNVGDLIPNFEKWPHACQTAHLELGWVVKDESLPSLIEEPVAELKEIVEPIVLPKKKKSKK